MFWTEFCARVPTSGTLPYTVAMISQLFRLHPQETHQLLVTKGILMSMTFRILTALVHGLLIAAYPLTTITNISYS